MGLLINKMKRYQNNSAKKLNYIIEKLDLYKYTNEGIDMGNFDQILIEK